MSFDDLNHFQKMEDPEERKGEDLVRNKKKTNSFEKKSKVRSVSLGTFKLSSTLVSLIVWSIFLVVVGYATYRVIEIFTSN